MRGRVAVTVFTSLVLVGCGGSSESEGPGSDPGASECLAIGSITVIQDAQAVIMTQEGATSGEKVRYLDAIVSAGESPDVLEIGLWAAQGMYGEWGGAPGAGVVAGIGSISGREVVVVADDASVKAGAKFPLGIKKVLRAQEIALENRLPVVYLVDSAGVFLPMQDEIFPDREHYGRIFYNNARISAAGVFQMAAIVGSCVAGGAYLIELASTTPSAANIVAYADIVRDKAILRQLIDVGTDIVNSGFQPEGRDSADILEEAERQVLAIAQANSDGKSDFTPVTKALAEAFDVLQTRYANGDGNPNSDRPSLIERNIYQGPSYASLDLRVSREFALTNGARVELLVDLFNVFNRDNVKDINTVWGSLDYPGTLPAPELGFGTPRDVFNPYQTQFAARFKF